jgi:hypothetical protein
VGGVVSLQASVTVKSSTRVREAKASTVPAWPRGVVQAWSTLRVCCRVGGIDSRRNRQNGESETRKHVVQFSGEMEEGWMCVRGECVCARAR